MDSGLLESKNNDQYNFVFLLKSPSDRKLKRRTYATEAAITIATDAAFRDIPNIRGKYSKTTYDSKYIRLVFDI